MNAPVSFIDENFPTVRSYPVPPPPQQMPTQEIGTRPRPSGPVDCQEEGGESEAEQARRFGDLRELDVVDAEDVVGGVVGEDQLIVSM